MRTPLILTLLGLLALLPILSACDTMEGAGQDISNGGKDLSDSAERNK